MALLNTVNTCVFYNYSVLIGAWIVTGGRHYGVMKHVGEAVRDYTIAVSYTHLTLPTIYSV